MPTAMAAAPEMHATVTAAMTTAMTTATVTAAMTAAAMTATAAFRSGIPGGRQLRHEEAVPAVLFEQPLAG